MRIKGEARAGLYGFEWLLMAWNETGIVSDYLEEKRKVFKGVF